MDELKVVRWKQRFENFAKAYNLLSSYIDIPPENNLERAGIIQFFEVSFELAWKLLKDYLAAQEIRVLSPRDAIKQALQTELIEDGHLWIAALADRNLTVHTYDEEIARKMVLDIKEKYFPELEKLYLKLKKEL